MAIDPTTQSHLEGVMFSALDKLKASMADGPGGANAVLTAEESAMLYRTLTEVFGVQHRERK